MMGLKNVLALAVMGSVLTACATHDLNRYEEVLVGEEWVTTNAIDEKTRSIGSHDKRVADYYGAAHYYANGTFEMYTPTGEEKLQGTWSISDDGSVRTIVAKDDKGEVKFTRDVENIVITPTDYVYRIYPSERNKNRYIDIVHQPKQK